MTILKQKASMLRLTTGSMRYEISGEVSQGWGVRGKDPGSHFSEDESGRMAGWGLAVTGREGLGFELCGGSRFESKR